MILKDLGVAIPVNTSNYLLFIYLYLTEQKHLLRIRRNLIVEALRNGQSICLVVSLGKHVFSRVCYK